MNSIGNTPLLRLPAISSAFPGVEILAKAEFLNPGGSVKDRPGLSMVREGERTGQLTKARTILDATSGNTGIAYAMIGAALGYQVRLCLPQNASPERKQILKAYGADLILTDPGAGSDGAIVKCREVYENDPNRYFYPDQYNNPANWKAHFETTAPEILSQTNYSLTHFVAMLGTSGTFTGTARRLKRDLPTVKCLSAQPDQGFHGIEGTKHMPTAIVPGIYDETLADENLWISTEGSYAMTKRMAREEGLLVGISAGANVLAATQIAARLVENGETGVIVTILCDGAAKYLSEPFWHD
ncbi:PLP-dependent cysteine synthase family protein [Bryobacter aggregatus]|uniref:PLP-dependent cysteine synthase family protein n=1 Tax=Bryobacter aggregatus TaxID=360054 RepID=UPI001EE2E11D|nr:cysteine synthase family protein [Bryobacter aggregatus]